VDCFVRASFLPITLPGLIGRVKLVYVVGGVVVFFK
jgi:hypothetical protein